MICHAIMGVQMRGAKQRQDDQAAQHRALVLLNHATSLSCPFPTTQWLQAGDAVTPNTIVPIRNHAGWPPDLLAHWTPMHDTPMLPYRSRSRLASHLTASAPFAYAADACLGLAAMPDSSPSVQCGSRIRH